MDNPRSGPRAVLVLVTVMAIIATACGGTTTSTAPAAPSASAESSATPEPTPLVTAAPAALGPAGEPVIRWFVGLGTGGQPQQVATQTQVVTAFNDSQDDLYVSLEIYDNKVAGNILKTQIAAGNPPDIIGPVGVEGLNLFLDQLLDLEPLIASEGFDTSKFDPALVDFFKIGVDGATIGVPFATYPSYLWYNKALFDEANIAYPPSKVGDMYEGKPWDMAAVREIGMKLTVDKNGNDATSPDFDPQSVVQWGFDVQWADNSPLAESALFGAGSFVGDDRKTAQIPDSVRAGEKWFNDGVWTDHFIPNANQINSDLLAKGNEFSSGNLAMNQTHSWYSCCVNPAPPAEPIVKDFGWAVTPAYNGKVTSKLHADTFSILKTTKNPEAAFKALSVLATSGELLTVYGAFPADPALQQGFFDTVNAQYPDVKLDWSVPQAMLGYPDIPNHQAWVPDYAKSKTAWQAFQNKYRTSAGVDIDAELDALKTELQGIFDASGE
jgi:multiple sugar transport system substrate-binding protein